MSRKIYIILLALVLALGMTGQAAAGMEGMKHEGHEMMMHHVHIMMNHGLSMVTEGSNMAMLAQMEMTPSLDPMTLKHGRSMIADGKAVIQRSLSGPEMMGMHEAGTTPETDPQMKYTHDLGEAMFKVVDILEKMSMEGMTSPDMMAMHHMHILLNHALDMYLEGSNMVMLGQMGMSGSVDDFSIEHGKMMMKNARALYTEVMEGKEMMKMHKGGMAPEKDPHMMETHKLAESILKVMDLLDKMPAMK
ncbi:MAG: hypothetical protein P8Y85_01780 [Nitrospirota bacterium]|jgi:hypothetical protein